MCVLDLLVIRETDREREKERERERERRREPHAIQTLTYLSIDTTSRYEVGVCWIETEADDVFWCFQKQLHGGKKGEREGPSVRDK